MSDDPTHYDILGVDPRATKDEIRAAYRERIEAAREDQTRQTAAKRPNETALRTARDEEAQVRAAWQVLSDPYQRGRYDASIQLEDVPRDADGVDLDVDDDLEDEEQETAAVATRDRRGTRPPREGAPPRPLGMLATERPPTPASWPRGLVPPPNRARTIAMLIDVMVLAVLVILQQALGGFVLDTAYPKESKQLDKVSDQIDRLDTQKNRADSRLDKAKSQVDAAKKKDEAARTRARAALATSRKESKRLDGELDKANKRQDDLRSDVAPAQIVLSFAVLGLALLYLVPWSVRNGRTLGKHLLQIRAVNADGSPLRVSSALSRYATPLLFALVVASFLGPFGFAIALFGVLTWPRNANLQGLHDRFARTLVVDG